LECYPRTSGGEIILGGAPRSAPSAARASFLSSGSDLHFALMCKSNHVEQLHTKNH